MRKEIFLDLETNQSLDPLTGTITEIGIIYRVNGKVRKKIEIKEDIYKNLVKFLDSVIDRFNTNDKAYFIAYNAKFDNDFIRQLFLKNNNKFYGSYFYNPVIDIMQIVAYKFMLKDIRPENFKLGTICKYFKIKVEDDKLHSAIYDIEKTKEVYNIIKKF